MFKENKKFKETKINRNGGSKMKTLRNAKGFTLIELIMVIVILGILSAVAIPKYMDMKLEATKATASGVLGALTGSESMLFANRVLNSTTYDLTTIVDNVVVSGVTLGTPTATSVTVLVSGSTYTITYAAGSATAAGIFTKSW